MADAQKSHPSSFQSVEFSDTNLNNKNITVANGTEQASGAKL